MKTSRALSHIRSSLLFLVMFIGWMTGCTRTHTISHYAHKVNVTLGQTVQRPPKGPTKIVLKEIDFPASKAYLHIIGPEGIDQGWAEEGKFVNFSPQSGTEGIEVVAVRSNYITIVCRSAGDSKGWRAFPWKNNVRKMEP